MAKTRCKELDSIKKRLTTKAGVEDLKKHFYFDSVKALIYEIYETTDDSTDAFIEVCNVLLDIEENKLLSEDEIKELTLYSFVKSLS